MIEIRVNNQSRGITEAVTPALIPQTPYILIDYIESLVFTFL